MSNDGIKDAQTVAADGRMLRDVVTVADVLASPRVADPLHKLDCCVVSDGGGALLVVAPEAAQIASTCRTASRTSAGASR